MKRGNVTALHDAVDRAAALHADDREWEALLVATVYLASATAQWEQAKKAYTDKHPVGARRTDRPLGHRRAGR